VFLKIVGIVALVLVGLGALGWLAFYLLRRCFNIFSGG
jgi:hypothetical protein